MSKIGREEHCGASVRAVAAALSMICLSLACGKEDSADTVDAQLVLQAMEEMRHVQGLSTTVGGAGEFAKRVAEDNTLVLLGLEMAKSDIELCMDALTAIHVGDEAMDKAVREAISRFHSDLFAVWQAARTSYNEEGGLTVERKPAAAPSALIKHHEAAASASKQARANLEELVRIVDTTLEDELKRTLLQQTLSRGAPALAALEAALSLRIDALRLAFPAETAGTAPELDAIAAIERVGGKILYDDDVSKTRVIGVQFDGGVGDDVLQYVAQLPDIERLVFFHAPRITDASMTQISELRNLNVLSLYATGVTDRGLDALSRLPRLEWLSLSACAITDAGLQPIGKIQTLKILDLWGTRITAAGLPSLRGLTNLEELNLRGAPLDDASLQHLAHMTRMKRLDLGAEYATNERLDEMVEHLRLMEKKLSGQPIAAAEQARMEQLAAIEQGLAQRPKIGDGGLVHLRAMTELEQLTLSGTRVTDAALEVIKSFKKLIYVDLGNTEVTDAGREELRKALPKLYVQ